jgi:hypothetical protein
MQTRYHCVLQAAGMVSFQRPLFVIDGSPPTDCDPVFVVQLLQVSDVLAEAGVVPHKVADPTARFVQKYPDGALKYAAPPQAIVSPGPRPLESVLNIVPPSAGAPDEANW